jgi:hypothetical protein
MMTGHIWRYAKERQEAANRRKSPAQVHEFYRYPDSAACIIVTISLPKLQLLIFLLRIEAERRRGVPAGYLAIQSVRLSQPSVAIEHFLNLAKTRRAIVPLVLTVKNHPQFPRIEFWRGTRWNFGETQQNFN